MFIPILGFIGASLLLFEGAYIHVKTPFRSPTVQVKKDSISVYIINLDRSKERYSFVEPTVKKLGYPYMRVSAVEGANLSNDEINEKVDVRAYSFFMGESPRRGTIGCSLSHIKVWEQFLASENEFALVFEDDVRFNPLELRMIVDELIRDSNLWDVNFFELSHRGMPRTIKKYGNNKKYKLSVYLTKVTHTGCYLINRKAALAMREHAYPIKMPIDHFIPRGWEYNLKFTGIEPRLVTQTFGDSEIMQTTSTVKKEKIPLIAYMARGIYTLKSEVTRFVYAIYQYKNAKA